MHTRSLRKNSRASHAERCCRLRFEVLERRDLLAAADLNGWSGSGNTASPNNYTASANSAGGVLDDRRFGGGQAASFLADTSLAVPGGVLTASTSGGFSAAGTISIDASTNNWSLADPVFYFGFFDKDDLTKGAFGFSLADSSTTAFRFRAAAGTTQTAGNGTVLAEGTYTFDLDVNNVDSGAGKVRFRVYGASPTPVVDVSVSTSGVTLQADSFGFLQPLAASASDTTFGITVSNINYTGETQLPAVPPVTLAGDYNNDGTVDASDYVVWRQHNGTAVVVPNDTTSGNVSADDYNVWKANFGNTALPAAASNLVATVGTEQISLSWQDNSLNETGFSIERRIGSSGAFSQIATVSSNIVSFNDTDVDESTTYQYQVRAVNTAGSSAASNIASATILSEEMINVAAVNYSRTQIYHSPQSPGWTSWAGAWIMPNGDLMVGVTQATGPVSIPGVNRAAYNYSGLDIDVVYLRGVRATDGSGNVTWTKVTDSDVSFTTADNSGMGTHANNSPTTVVLNNGALLRRVYGWDYADYPDLPGTTFMQISTDGGLTWSAPPVSTNGGVTWSDPSPIQEFLLDPATTTVQMTRTRRLSDGRLLIGGSVWNGKNTQSAPNEPLLMVSSDEGVSWQRVNFSGPAYDPTGFNEWDFAELDNGDLFIVSRPKSNDRRYQGIMSKVDDSWQLQSWELSVLPHSGHPELIKTHEGPVLHIATTGVHWTNDAGEHWNVLTGFSASRYYPHSLQTTDGWIYVFGHNGSDNYYGQVDQALWMDKFKLQVTPAAVGAALSGEAESQAAKIGNIEQAASPAISATFAVMGTDDTVEPPFRAQEFATNPLLSSSFAARKDDSLRLLAERRAQRVQAYDSTEHPVPDRSIELTIDEALSQFEPNNWRQNASLDSGLVRHFVYALSSKYRMVFVQRPR